jgi:hypothetical protein
LFDNPVGCLSSLAISRLAATELRYFDGSCSITEVIEQLYYENDRSFKYRFFHFPVTFRRGELISAICLFVLALSVSGCKDLNLLNPENGSGRGCFQNDDVPVVFTGIDVEETVTTTQISLNFDIDIPGLAADDIAISDMTVSAEPGEITVDSLVKTNLPWIYTLLLAGVNTSGEIFVTVKKNGYRIEPPSLAGEIYGENSHSQPNATDQAAFLFLAVDGAA